MPRQRILQKVQILPRSACCYPQNRSESDDENDGSEAKDIKNRILGAALNHVKHRGWSHRAIVDGAESVGYSGSSHGMFPRGGIELVSHFYVTCNEKLAQELNENSRAHVKRARGHEEFLQHALEMRLRMILPYIDTWTQAMGLMSLPPNIPEATRNLQTLVDDVWYYAGGRSTDFSWYTKRAGLGAVYVSTQLAMIQDRSEDYADTWSFLNRRIKQLETANQGFTEKQAFMEGIPAFVQSSMVSLKNMLGFQGISSRRPMH